MAIDSRHLLPTLPPELQLIILQMALENNMTNAKNLLFIAKHVFDWLIPILYKVVILSRKDLYAWPPLPLPIAKLPQYGRHVHRLLLLSSPGHIIDQYLQHCPNIVDFSSSEELSDAQWELALRLPLHQLNPTFITWKQYSNPSNPSLFSKITHITSNGEQLGRISHNRYPSLTHVVIPSNSYSAHEVEGIFQRNPGLKVLVVGSSTARNMILPELKHNPIHGDNDLDARVVHLEYNAINNWKTRNIWSVAERVVEERHARARAKHSV
ncbi:hypothetical protein BDN72DRAFT_956167 [Pluteus cervinus]|uniref:Uncharacterized protein n=1 Tax=Pluteus cervinus TaxID=181527 RepID=A0ACD3B9Y6_9AGAR|nr:hypothetical protein BDN72DRAFT_956167 [Pluteus cervinus]